MMESLMHSIYGVMDAMFPFAWASHTFMKHAFLAVLLVTPLFGLLSTMVVSNRMAFFSDSLGHGAFTGIAVGVLLGAVSPIASLVVFSILFSFCSLTISVFSQELLVEPVGRKGKCDT